MASTLKTGKATSSLMQKYRMAKEQEKKREAELAATKSKSKKKKHKKKKESPGTSRTRKTPAHGSPIAASQPSSGKRSTDSSPAGAIRKKVVVKKVIRKVKKRRKDDSGLTIPEESSALSAQTSGSTVSSAGPTGSSATTKSVDSSTLSSLSGVMSNNHGSEQSSGRRSHKTHNSDYFTDGLGIFGEVGSSMDKVDTPPFEEHASTVFGKGPPSFDRRMVSNAESVSSISKLSTLKTPPITALRLPGHADSTSDFELSADLTPAGLGTHDARGEDASRFSVCSSRSSSSGSAGSRGSLDSIDSTLIKQLTAADPVPPPAAPASAYKRTYNYSSTVTPKSTRQGFLTSEKLNAFAARTAAGGTSNGTSASHTSYGRSKYLETMERFGTPPVTAPARRSSEPSVTAPSESGVSMLSMQSHDDGEVTSMHLMKSLVFNQQLEFYSNHLDRLVRELEKVRKSHGFVCRLMLSTCLEYLGLDPNGHRLVEDCDFYDYHQYGHFTGAMARRKAFEETTPASPTESDVMSMSELSRMTAATAMTGAKFDDEWNEIGIDSKRGAKRAALRETTVLEDVWEEIHDPTKLDPCDICGARVPADDSSSTDRRCRIAHDNLCDVDTVIVYFRQQMRREKTMYFRGLVALVHLGVDDKIATCPLSKVQMVFKTAVSRRRMIEKLDAYKGETQSLKDMVNGLRAECSRLKTDLEDTRYRLLKSEEAEAAHRRRKSSSRYRRESDDYVHGDELVGLHSSKSSGDSSPKAEITRVRIPAKVRIPDDAPEDELIRLLKSARIRDLSILGTERAETPHHIQLDGDVSDEGTPATERRFAFRSSMQIGRRNERKKAKKSGSRESSRRRASIASVERAYGMYEASRSSRRSHSPSDGDYRRRLQIDYEADQLTRMEDSKRTWKSYLDRDTYIKQRYPTEYKDRNSAWQRWTTLLDGVGDYSIIREQSVSQIWSYIDFARMSLGRYANWMWFPLKRRADGYTDEELTRMALDSEDCSSSAGISHQSSSSSSIVSCMKAYDEESGILWCKKYGLLMDFNLLLFDHYVEPANLQDTLLMEHLVLSLASVNRIIRDVEHPAQFYLHTVARSGRKYLQFRCDSSSMAASAESARDEWCDELEYQILIVRDLLRIPRIKMRVADGNGSLWLPNVMVTDPHPSTASHSKRKRLRRSPDKSDATMDPSRGHTHRRVVSSAAVPSAYVSSRRAGSSGSARSASSQSRSTRMMMAAIGVESPRSHSRRTRKFRRIQREE